MPSVVGHYGLSSGSVAARMANSRGLAIHAAEFPNVVVLGDFNLRPCNCFRHAHARAGGAKSLTPPELDLRARTGSRCTRCDSVLDSAPQLGGEAVAEVFELVAPPAGPDGWTFGRFVQRSIQLAPHGCLDYALTAGGEMRLWRVREAYVAYAGRARGELGCPLSDHKIVRFECNVAVREAGDMRYVEKTRFDRWGEDERAALASALQLREAEVAAVEGSVERYHTLNDVFLQEVRAVELDRKASEAVAAERAKRRPLRMVRNNNNNNFQTQKRGIGKTGHPERTDRKRKRQHQRAFPNTQAKGTRPTHKGRALKYARLQSPSHHLQTPRVA